MRNFVSQSGLHCNVDRVLYAFGIDPEDFASGIVSLRRWCVVMRCGRARDGGDGRDNPVNKRGGWTVKVEATMQGKRLIQTTRNETPPNNNYGHQIAAHWSTLHSTREYRIELQL